jgi:hypothetical protein
MIVDEISTDQLPAANSTEHKNCIRTPLPVPDVDALALLCPCGP